MPVDLSGSSGVGGPDDAKIQESQKNKTHDLIRGSYVNNMINALQETIEVLQGAMEASQSDSSQQTDAKKRKEALVKESETAAIISQDEGATSPLKTMHKNMEQLKKYASDAKSMLASNKDVDPQTKQEHINKIQRTISQLQNQQLTNIQTQDPQTQAHIQKLQTQLNHFTSEVSTALNNQDSRAALGAFTKTHDTTHEPGGSGAKAQALIDTTSNALGSAPPKDSGEGDLWGSIEQFIFGFLMHDLSGKLSEYQWIVSLENAGLFDLTAIIKKWAGFASKFNITMPGSPTPGNQKEWAKFKSELSKFKHFMSQTPGGANSLKRYLKSKVSDLRKLAHRTVTITTKNGGHTKKQVTLSKLISLANKLSSEFNKFSKALNSLDKMNYPGSFIYTQNAYYTTVRVTHGTRKTPTLKQQTYTKMMYSTTPGGQRVHWESTFVRTVKTSKTIHTWSSHAMHNHKGHLHKGAQAAISDFHNAVKSFYNGVKTDTQQIQNLSNSAQAHLRLELMYYQEFMQTAPQLIQTLNDLAKSIAANMKGGN